MVEGVKGFKAQFDGLTFVDANVLFNRHVAVIDARTIERVTVGSSKSAAGRIHRKGRCAVREPVVTSISLTRIGGLSRTLVSARIHNFHRCNLVGPVRTGKEREAIIVTSERMAAEVKYWNRESFLKRVYAHHVPVIGQPSKAVPRELVEGQRVLVANHQTLRCVALGGTIRCPVVVRVKSGEIKGAAFQARSFVEVP